MSLFRRNQTWWVRFTTPSGKRIRRSTGTRDKRLAREFHDQLVAESWRIDRLGDRPRRLWQEAVVKWLNETSHKKTHEKDKERLVWLDGFLRGKYLDEIDRELIEEIAEAKEAEGRTAGTVNRHLALIRAILRRAKDEWNWIDAVPRFRFRKEPDKRVRFLTQKQAAKLLAQLPEHLRDMAVFALATGLRMHNVVRLSWEQVDLERSAAWIHPDQAKGGKAIAVPLNGDALAVLHRRQGIDDTWVFTYREHPVRTCSTKAWYKALRRAGIKDFRWHDLRHTWASWHAQSGTPLSVLQELGGWAGPTMVQRYAHLSVEHLAPYAERVCADTNLAHHPEDDQSRGQ